MTITKGTAYGNYVESMEAYEDAKALIAFRNTPPAFLLVSAKRKR